MERLTCAHISAYLFIEFGPPITLANQAVGLLTTEGTAYSCVVDLIENKILQFLIIVNNDTRDILGIRATAQQAVIDIISM